VDDDGVVRKPPAVEPRQEVAQEFVEGVDAGEVRRPGALADPFGFVLAVGPETGWSSRSPSVRPRER